MRGFRRGVSRGEAVFFRESVIDEGYPRRYINCTRYRFCINTTEHPSMPHEPRIAPLEPPYEPEAAAALERRMPKNSPVPPIALFRLLARHPVLATAMEPLGNFHLRRGPGGASLPARAREVVILRTCARLGCEYEWGVHVAHFAERVGLTPDEIAETVHSPGGAPALTGVDRLLVDLVDALHDHGKVGDATWAALAREFSASELLELLVLAGWYHAIAFVANGARVPLESWGARFPAPPSP
jgi:alkylhydroperoxidase family enzyme